MHFVSDPLGLGGCKVRPECYLKQFNMWTFLPRSCSFRKVYPTCLGTNRAFPRQLLREVLLVTIATRMTGGFDIIGCSQIIQKRWSPEASFCNGCWFPFILQGRICKCLLLLGPQALQLCISVMKALRNKETIPISKLMLRLFGYP